MNTAKMGIKDALDGVEGNVSADDLFKIAIENEEDSESGLSTEDRFVLARHVVNDTLYFWVDDDLTRKQRDAAHLIASGYTGEQVSIHEDRSESTIKDRMKRIKALTGMDTNDLRLYQYSLMKAILNKGFDPRATKGRLR